MRSEAVIFALAEDPINRIEALSPWRLALQIHAICGKPRSGGTCHYLIGSTDGWHLWCEWRLFAVVFLRGWSERVSPRQPSGATVWQPTTKLN